MGRSDSRRSLETKRLQYATEQLEQLGYVVTQKSECEINFYYKRNLIKVFPYSGWYSGKGIESKRGIKNLLTQLGKINRYTEDEAICGHCDGEWCKHKETNNN